MLLENKDLAVCHYAAAFIDLLGQRDQLRGCALLPDSLDDLRPLIRATIGPIKWLQDSFADFYGALRATTRTAGTTEEYRKGLEELRKVELKYQRFSDGLVMFVSLMGNPRPEPINGLYGLIASCGSICLLGLARETPIRGGADVAWGIELNSNELYGCVVANSYALESEIAQHPRIVLGEHIVRYLHTIQALSGSDILTQYMRDLATVSLEMITKDTDGAWIVDYLGPGFRKYIAAKLDSSTYQTAFSFVDKQIAFWKNVDNQKLLNRYLVLKQYFEKNRQHWM